MLAWAEVMYPVSGPAVRLSRFQNGTLINLVSTRWCELKVGQTRVTQSIDDTLGYQHAVHPWRQEEVMAGPARWIKMRTREDTPHAIPLHPC